MAHTVEWKRLCKIAMNLKDDEDGCYTFYVVI